MHRASHFVSFYRVNMVYLDSNVSGDNDFRLTPSASEKMRDFKPVLFDRIGLQEDKKGAHR